MPSWQTWNIKSNILNGLRFNGFFGVRELFFFKKARYLDQTVFWHVAKRVPVKPGAHCGEQEPPDGVTGAQSPGTESWIVGSEQAVVEQEPETDL
jgi:hypothetical protein